MSRWLLLAPLVLMAASQQKDAKGDPDVLYKKELGVSIQKPGKNDEWEFKDQFFFAGTQLCVAHKVDRVGIEIYVQEKAPSGSYYDPKSVAESEWKALAGSNTIKDAKRIGDIKAGKLPNGGANNPMSYFVDATFKDKSDKAMEIKFWCFVGKENQNLYKVSVTGEEGTYKKHQKLLDLMLGSIKILKVPK